MKGARREVHAQKPDMLPEECSEEQEQEALFLEGMLQASSSAVNPLDMLTITRHQLLFEWVHLISTGA